MKNKKSIIAVLIVACLLIGGILTWRSLSHKDVAPGPDTGDVTILPDDKQPVEGSSSNNDNNEGDVAGEDGQEGTDEPVIMDDNGDVVIIVPDDQESGGL